MHILHVAGARPNFMKVAPVIVALRQYAGVDQTLVHTGQHYDAAMSKIFFEQLDLPHPNVNLGIGSGSHAMQTAQVMMRFEEVLLSQRPDMVLVYGDVNSTVAVALVCAKMSIPVAHVEAGLRSFDRSMPEEINRLLTDQVADLLFTPSSDGDTNLLREGITPTKIYCVGNVMIDTLVRLLPMALAKWQDGRMAVENIWFDQDDYILVTLHRPSNVDDPVILHQLIVTLNEISHDIPIIFPIHPRTRKRLESLPGLAVEEKLTAHGPTGADYFGFVRGVWSGLPPVFMGRAMCDQALLHHCLRRRIPVIDATLAVVNVHQYHGYQHVAGGSQQVFRGEDRAAMAQAHGLKHSLPTVADADWRFVKNDKLEPDRIRRNLLRRAELSARYKLGLDGIAIMLRGMQYWRGKSRVVPRSFALHMFIEAWNS